MRTGVEAAEYAAEIQRLAHYLGVSNGNRQEGSLRFDVNVSVRPIGQSQLHKGSLILASYCYRRKKVLFELELNAFDVHSYWQCAGALTEPLLYCQV